MKNKVFLRVLDPQIGVLLMQVRLLNHIQSVKELVSTVDFINRLKMKQNKIKNYSINLCEVKLNICFYCLQIKEKKASNSINSSTGKTNCKSIFLQRSKRIYTYILL